MQPQTDVVERTTDEALEGRKAVSDLDGLEEWRVSTLGRNGALTDTSASLGMSEGDATAGAALMFPKTVSKAPSPSASRS